MASSDLGELGDLRYVMVNRGEQSESEHDTIGASPGGPKVSSDEDFAACARFA